MTKEVVLNYFENNKGEILSGAELAEKLGVTRTAIWKAINTLREDGYDIESIKKKGYRLNVNSDILSTIKIQGSLEDDKYDLRVFKTIDSTNKLAKVAAITEDKEWIVIASEEQEQGKGRGQKHFSSPNGKGVYMSIILRPYVEIKDRKLLMYLSAVAVIEAIRDITGIQATVKSPNEIMYQNNKLGGILSEAILELETERIEALIIGIGLNVYGTKENFDNQSNDINTSIGEVIGKYCNRSELIASILNYMDKYYEVFKVTPEMISENWCKYKEMKE
ncbi:MAG: biotin--[acetyl-CoA-carboxylase] ligase [Cellulosilyticaceae bacterium]